jgi:hypothetical protein
MIIPIIQALQCTIAAMIILFLKLLNNYFIETAFLFKQQYSRHWKYWERCVEDLDFQCNSIVQQALGTLSRAI